MGGLVLTATNLASLDQSQPLVLELEDGRELQIDGKFEEDEVERPILFHALSDVKRPGPKG